jgi:hypothetical protein
MAGTHGQADFVSWPPELSAFPLLSAAFGARGILECASARHCPIIVLDQLAHRWV